MLRQKQQQLEDLQRIAREQAEKEVILQAQKALDEKRSADQTQSDIIKAQAEKLRQLELQNKQLQK